LIGGVDFERASVISAAFERNGSHFPVPDFSNKFPQFTNYKVGVYGQDEAKLFSERVILTLGARYDHHERYGNTFNPRSGVVYKPTDTSTFKFLYGRAFREPTVFELRNNIAVQGSVSNLTLATIKPMTVDTVELGWHQYLGQHFKNEATVFYNWAHDLIVAQGTVPGAISNSGELKAMGFEDVLHYKYKNFSGFLNYTYTTARLTEPGQGTHKEYDVPPHKANLALLYEFWDIYSAGVLLRFRSAVDTQYSGQVFTIPDFVVCDLTFNVLKFPWLKKYKMDASLDIIAKNIFDKTYYDPEPRAPTVLQSPQEGRSLFVNLTIKI
jgi:iron complex outermembrane receptor protein